MRKSVAVVLVSLAAVGSPAAAHVDQFSLPAVTDSVRKACLDPERRENLFQAEREGRSGVGLRLVEAGLTGTLPTGAWDEMKRVIDEGSAEPRQCTVEALRVFVPNFKPFDGLLGVDGDEVRQTLSEIIADFRNDVVAPEKYIEPLSAQIARQKQVFFPLLDGAGQLQELSVLSRLNMPNDKKLHHYIAHHEQAAFLWTISRNTEGVVDILYVQPVQ
jgi:hypothetical protein